MTTQEPDEDLVLAERWCEKRGEGWRLGKPLGQGGTAPVFEIESPDGPRALKINSSKFSHDEIELERIHKQLELRDHDCPSLVHVFDGGVFEERPYILMSRADGSELEKCLPDVPREFIRTIVDQVARAAIFLEERGLCHRDIKAANIYVSDDYSKATLLDISVIRDINDPVGLGTDHEGQLPVVATARYSPPEYLFRLLEPGQNLWHALTVFQLGALLHDLIMREPMFQSEYRASAQNRYRFAWNVATKMPAVEADDVDEDLLFLARRALDKSWERRSRLSLGDFLSDPSIGRRHALQLLGIGAATEPSEDSLSDQVRRVTEISRELEEAMLAYFKENGVQARHRIDPCASDKSKKVVFEWEGPPLAAPQDPQPLRYELTLSLTNSEGGPVFEISASLTRQLSSDEQREQILVPPIENGDDASQRISKEAERVLESLAMQLARK